MKQGGWLWLAAAVVTVVAAGWQRRTGPTHPYRTTVAAAGAESRLVLPRSHVTTSGARVAVPASAAADGGTLHWRRYPTAEPFSGVALRREGGELAATMPAEPPAGKVEYYLELGSGGDPVRIPPEEGKTVILRYQDPVPLGILVPHIVAMFAAMLIGIRAGLAALVEPQRARALTLATLAILTVGGLVLGPLTQRYAFGALWTGVPFGWDLTDNKTLLMWLGWAAAGWAAWRRVRIAPRLAVSAALLMLVVYVVPHSLSGSQLDYSTVPASAPPVR